MSTVPETRTIGKVFYAHLFEQAGALVHVNGIITFVADDGDIVEVEPSMVNFLTVLGEMTAADGQRIADLMAGGYAGRACSRLSEVA
jgi:predicted transcriptional regulator